MPGPTAPETPPLTHSAATETQAAERELDSNGPERLATQATIMVVTTLVALAASLAMINRDPPSDRDARRRARRRKKKLAAKAKPSPARTYNKLLLLLGLLLILFLLFLALAMYSHSLPLEQTRLVEETLYTHRGFFDYTFSVSPADQYVIQEEDSQGRMTLVSQGREGTLAPVSLARTVELEFHYSIEGWDDAPLWIDIDGDISLRASNHRSQGLLSMPMRSFAGTQGIVSTSVAMQQVGELIDSIEEQGGQEVAVYELVFAPRVFVQGEGLEDTYRPEYVIEIDNSEIRPSMELEHVEHRTEAAMTTFANTLPPVFGRSLSVGRARALGLYGALVPGLATMLLGAWISWGLFTVPTARIAARYGKMLVEVDTVENPGTRRIRVQSIHDVARAAKKGGQPILHHESETEHMYCVADGESMYIYSLPKDPEEP